MPVTPSSVRQFCEAVGGRLERLVLTGGGAGTGIEGGLGQGALFAPLLDGGGASALRAVGWGTLPQLYVTALRDERGRWSTLELRCEPFNLLANEQGYYQTMARALVEGLGAWRFELGRVVVREGDKEGVESGEQLLARVAKKVERVSAVMA